MAIATDFDVLLLARAIQGATLPAFISVGASVVTRLAPPAQQGKGLARANIGFVLGILLALPAGTALAQNGDWRVPFLVLAIASFPAIALIGLFFPAVPPGAAFRVSNKLRLFPHHSLPS